MAGRRLDPPGLLLPGGILPAWGVAVHLGLIPGVLLSKLGAVGWTKGGLGFQRRRGGETRVVITHGHTPTGIFGPGVTPEMPASDDSFPIAHLLGATKILAPAAAEWRGIA